MHEPLRVRLSERELRIENDLYACEFKPEAGGLPSALRFAGDNRSVAGASLRASRTSGGEIRPVLDAFRPRVRQEEDAVFVSFENVPWQDAHGAVLPGFRLALNYEFHADGAVFVDTFFHTETLDPGTLDGFLLEADVAPGRAEDANWAYWKLPADITGKLIQDLGGFERYLTSADDRRFRGTVLPFVSVDMGAQGRRDRHVEFFVESFNSLTLETANTETSVTWQGGKATVAWDFQRAAQAVPGRAYQWRNTWGWCLRRAPVLRRRAPLRVMHYLDNFVRYPSDALVGQIADQGADTLILHENWRLDMKNGEFPYDSAELQRVVDACRRHNLRLGLYVRGNEDGIRQNLARHLRPYLEKDRDGIYMDFGSPVCYMAREEHAPGGRIHFREYYEVTRRIREFVGDNGFFISHSGSFFSAIGHTTVDAYLGGEQEKGRLLESPTTHAYFSGLSIAASCLWTAAFPTYRTERVLPFLATAVQTPFLHLGTQLPTSSLDHPAVPSLLRFARPLWRLWELLDGEDELSVYSTQTSADVLNVDSEQTGASALVTTRGEALVVAANLSETARAVSVRLDEAALNVSPRAGLVALHAGAETCRYEMLERGDRLTAEVEGYGLAAWLLVADPDRWPGRLERFTRPFPSDPDAEREHRAHLESMRRRRFEPPTREQCFLRVWVPNFPNTLEESLWWDLFENRIELLDLRDRQAPRCLGYVTPAGLAPEPPQDDQRLWPGTRTPWLPLHRIVPPCDGAQAVPLALATRRGDAEFYSFVKAELSDAPARNDSTYDITFHNDIDLDWSMLTFNVRIARRDEGGNGGHPARTRGTRQQACLSAKASAS